MRRRDFLALTGSAAGLAGLAGCAGPAGTRTLPTPLPDEPGLPSGSTYRLGEEAGTELTAVAVLDARVRRSDHYRTASGALDVYSPPDSYLVSVRVTARGEQRPPLSAFELRVGEETYPALSSVDGRPPSAVLSRYDAYRPDAEPDPDGLRVMFEVPAGSTGETAAVVWSPSGGEPAYWPLRDQQQAALGRPLPPLSVAGFETPATAPADADPTATLRVENGGEVDGTLRAALNYAGAFDASETLSEAVPAGETVTTEYGLPWNGRRLEVELAWAGPHEQRTIEPEGG
jgi:hypothetical protein